MGRTGRLLGTVLLAGILLGLFKPPSGAHFAPVSTPAVPSPPSSPGTPTWSALNVTALGDSVTAGSHCDCSPFPQLYAAGLQHRYAIPVQIANDGVGGQTSADVSTELRRDRAVRADVARADVVVLTIGANDFGPAYAAVTGGTCGADDRLACARPALATLADRLPVILAHIADLRSHRPTAVLVTGYWNVFEDGNVAEAAMSPRGRQTSEELTRAANKVIAAAASRAGDRYVDLYAPFKGASAEKNPTSLLADDGDHPNAAGHRLIAKTLLAAGLAPLQPHQ